MDRNIRHVLDEHPDLRITMDRNIRHVLDEYPNLPISKFINDNYSKIFFRDGLLYYNSVMLLQIDVDYQIFATIEQTNSEYLPDILENLPIVSLTIDTEITPEQYYAITRLEIRTLYLKKNLDHLHFENNEVAPIKCVFMKCKTQCCKTLALINPIIADLNDVPFINRSRLLIIDLIKAANVKTVYEYLDPKIICLCIHGCIHGSMYDGDIKLLLNKVAVIFRWNSAKTTHVLNCRDLRTIYNKDHPLYDEISSRKLTEFIPEGFKLSEPFIKFCEKLLESPVKSSRKN